jgi:hypothetical protein
MAIFSIAAMGSAASAAGVERIEQAAVLDFTIGYAASANGQHIEEKVPAGETVQRWTRMITTQKFEGIVHRLQPDQLLRNIASGLRTSCPGSRTSSILHMKVSARPAAEMQADCPRNPATGLPETFIIRAVAGAVDMYAVQVAFRHVPSADELKWARTHLDSLRLCVGRTCLVSSKD